MSFIDDIVPTSRGKLILLGFIVLIIALVLWNPASSKKNIPKSPSDNQNPPMAEQSKNFYSQIRRVSHVERGGDFIEDLFFIGDKEIARQKIENGAVVDHQGDKINGKVKFFNEMDQTHGEANYANNYRNGLSTAYFPNGKIMLEEEYKRGQIIKSKEYYADGRLRFESDYSEALKCPREKEVGVAKLYYPSGKKKYEWDLTWRQKGGFKKTYNTDGSLRYAAWFNDQCLKIKEEYPGASSIK